jgi:hypothetical protein
MLVDVVNDDFGTEIMQVRPATGERTRQSYTTPIMIFLSRAWAGAANVATSAKNVITTEASPRLPIVKTPVFSHVPRN